MSVRRTRIASIATAVAMTFALTACGGSDNPDKDAAPEKPASKTASMSGELTKDNFVERLTAAQIKAGTSQVRMEIDAGGQKNLATGQFKAGESVKDSAVALRIDGKSSGLGTLDLRLVNGAIYMNFGEMTGDKFMKLALDGSGDAAADQLGELIDQVNPTAQLEQFDAALKSFKQTGGAKTIDGVKALPYEIVLDTSKIDGMAAAAKKSGTKVPATLTYTMFLGPDDLPRRITAKVVAMSFALDYSKWGEPVDIKAPPASEISDKAAGGA